MDTVLVIVSFLLGFIEGVTEFLPVSSTAHLILIGHFFDFSSPGNTFPVLIQLGAVLAIANTYSGKIWYLLGESFQNSTVRHFFCGVFIAFLPAAVLGVLIHNFVKTILLDSLYLVCSSLIIGGVVLLWIDKITLKQRYHDIMLYPWPLCLKIGLCQCLSLIPGISRSGATIIGAVLMGANKRSATEFSFFLAIPTMFGAFFYDLFKNYEILSLENGFSIALGFVGAFLTATVVAQYFLEYIARYGFSLFGWWRIVVGILGLTFLFICE